LCGLALLACGVAEPVAAATVVRGAQVHVVLTSPTSCDVDAAYTIQTDRPGPVPFTLQTFDGTKVELSVANDAAVPASDLRQSGKTTVFSAQLQGAGTQSTTLRYRVTQAPAWAYRCPIWLPAVPTDGRPGTVRLEVEWPAGASITGSTLPPLQRAESRGSSSLSHIPAFVRVPYVGAGETRSALTGWDVTRVMDVATTVVLLGSSLVWVVLRERRRRRPPAAVPRS
jgi:hypothetical protein